MNKPRVILLMRVSSYRGYAFREAGKRLDVEIVAGVDVHPDLAKYWNATLDIQFDDPERAVETIVEYALQNPVQAVLAIDDSAAVIAAKASAALGLVHNSVNAAEAARNKYRMRQMFSMSNVPSPQFRLVRLAEAPEDISSQMNYPWGDAGR